MVVDVDRCSEVGGASFVAGDDVLQARDLVDQVADLVAGGEVGGADCRYGFIGLGDHLSGPAKALLLDLQFFAGLVDIGGHELGLARLDELVNGIYAGFGNFFGGVTDL